MSSVAAACPRLDVEDVAYEVARRSVVGTASFEQSFCGPCPDGGCGDAPEVFDVGGGKFGVERVFDGVGGEFGWCDPPLAEFDGAPVELSGSLGGVSVEHGAVGAGDGAGAFEWRVGRERPRVVAHGCVAPSGSQSKCPPYRSVWAGRSTSVGLSSVV